MYKLFGVFVAMMSQIAHVVYADLCWPQPPGSTCFSLTSANMTEGSIVPLRYVYNTFGCNGTNISPQLSWENAPNTTQSFALTLHDPDAPTQGGWYHWMMFNIPPTVTSIAENGTITNATTWINDFGFRGYGGPCPPAGDGMHRYQWTVYALSTSNISVPDDGSLNYASFEIHANTLSSAVLTLVLTT